MMFHPEANHRSAFLNSSVNEGVFIKHVGVMFGVDDVRGCILFARVSDSRPATLWCWADVRRREQ